MRMIALQVNPVRGVTIQGITFAGAVSASTQWPAHYGPHMARTHNGPQLGATVSATSPCVAVAGCVYWPSSRHKHALAINVVLVTGPIYVVVQ